MLVVHHRPVEFRGFVSRVGRGHAGEQAHRRVEFAGLGGIKEARAAAHPVIARNLRIERRHVEDVTQLRHRLDTVERPFHPLHRLLVEIFVRLARPRLGANRLNPLLEIQQLLFKLRRAFRL